MLKNAKRKLEVLKRYARIYGAPTSQALKVLRADSAGLADPSLVNVAADNFLPETERLLRAV